ncbi:MAG: M48 family metallopeptidase [Aeriscardovia sp.]|nr:M48 family metallopeptidase [Aeriscardovia sp.]
MTNQILKEKWISFQTYHIHCIYKKTQYIYLRFIRKTKNFEMTVPLSCKNTDINNFLLNKQAWLSKVLEQSTKYKEIDQQKWSADKKERAKQYLQHYLEENLTSWTQKIGIEPTHITLRSMTSRWGSCTPQTRRIRLNLALADLSDDLITYVLVHELIHLRINGHGKDFYAMMSTLLPDWETKQKQMNTILLV